MSLPQGGGRGVQRSTNCHHNFLSLPEGRGRGVEEVGPMSLYMEFFCGWHPLAFFTESAIFQSLTLSIQQQSNSLWARNLITQYFHQYRSSRYYSQQESRVPTDVKYSLVTSNSPISPMQGTFQRRISQQ